MSDTKMSGERAREILNWFPGAEDFDYRRSQDGAPSDFEMEEAIRIGAAAIEERDELVEALAGLVRGHCGKLGEEFPETGSQWLYEAVQLLVKHGRIVMVDGAYKWSDRR